MKPLVVLISVFLLTAALSKLFTKKYRFLFCGNFAMCIMLFFTALGHFVFADGMALMVPDFVPAKLTLVYITGMIEIILGLMLLFQKYRHIAGIAAIIFFILVLPANIYASLYNIDYETATYTGKGVAYLWFRVPLQMLLIVWVYVFAVKQPNYFFKDSEKKH